MLPVPARGRDHGMVGRIRVVVPGSVLVPVGDERERIACPLLGVGGDERLQVSGHRLQYVRGGR